MANLRHLLPLLRRQRTFPQADWEFYIPSLHLPPSPHSAISYTFLYSGQLLLQM
jgi:hypothetical protein